MSEVIKLEITVEDMSEAVKQEFDKAERRALYAAGVAIQEGATNSISGLYKKSNRAVKTGRLRASISFITSDYKSGLAAKAPKNSKETDALNGAAANHELVYGSNVEYASFVHEGTNKMTGRPFLREGVDKKRKEIEETISKIFKGEI